MSYKCNYNKRCGYIKKGPRKRGQLVIRNADKIAQAEVARTSSPMKFDGKCLWAISNIDIDVATDLELTVIKKHWRLASQIEKEIDRLHKNWIPALAAFVKHSQKTNNREEMTENMKIRQGIDFGWVSSLFVWLYKSIHFWKMDRKDIADATKFVKEPVRYLLIWGTDRRYCQEDIWIGRGKYIY